MAESIPEKPRDEMEIAFAGPLFNFAMVIIIIGMIKFIPGLPWPTKLISTGITLEKLNFAIMNYPLFTLFWVNFILGAFNLFLPALPLDGGRIFRAMLATKFSFVKATKIAALVSSFLAIALFIFGFFIGDLIIIIIAAFIYFGAAQERDMAILKEVARGIDLRDAINKRPMIIEGKMRVEEAAEIMKEKKKTALLVSLKKGYGVIGIDDVAKAMEENKKMKVSEACQKTRLIPIEKKGEIITAIFAKKLPIVAISEDNELIGTISENQINKMYALSKLSSRKGIN